VIGQHLFGILSSVFNELWSFKYGGSLGQTLRYSASICFETFPFPKFLNDLEEIGKIYHNVRHNVMMENCEGLTNTYNRVHNHVENSEKIVQLRSLQIKMAHAVSAAYGWSDLDFDHDFYETSQGIRFTISETLRRIVLDRLLALNHQRYEEEVKAGLHDKGKKSKAKKPVKNAKENPNELELF